MDKQAILALLDLRKIQLKEERDYIFKEIILLGRRYAGREKTRKLNEVTDGNSSQS